jgi:hypothetical protein
MLFAICYFCEAKIGGVAELAEGSRLLSGCGGNTSPRVRIPAPPPDFQLPWELKIANGIWLWVKREKLKRRNQ